MKWVMGWALAAVALVGCEGDQRVVHPQADEAWAMAQVTEVDEGEVVARVDGRPITRGDALEMWRHHPDLSPEELLERLVEQEVLAHRAYQEGIHHRREVGFARKQGMVSALLAEQVEAKAEPDQEGRQQLLDHVLATRRAPSGLRASHLVVVVPEEIRDREEREEQFERAREVIDEVIEGLDGATDDDALRRVAGAINAELKEDGLEVVVNEHLRFPRHGERFHGDHLPQGWVTVVGDFARGAESVASDELRGQLSEPLRSRFGWHLIRVDEIIAEEVVDGEVAEEFVDFELQVAAERRVFADQMDQWLEGVRYRIFPENLGRSFD